uniref:Uncharacterized protein n=1 Tax=Megaselia scalaris TaxID=36166 RepID=T1GBZ2_MEGSC
MMKREVGGNRRRRAETTLPQSVEQRQHPPFIIISYLNTLHIRQKTSSESNINLNATIRIQQVIYRKLSPVWEGELGFSCEYSLLLLF